MYNPRSLASWRDLVSSLQKAPVLKERLCALATSHSSSYCLHTIVIHRHPPVSNSQAAVQRHYIAVAAVAVYSDLCHVFLFLFLSSYDITMMTDNLRSRNSCIRDSPVSLWSFYTSCDQLHN